VRCFGKFLRACGDLPMRDDDATRVRVSVSRKPPAGPPTGPSQNPPRTFLNPHRPDDNKSKLRSKARALIDWWLNEFLVGLISLRSHHKLTRPHPLLHGQTYICYCYCYFLAQLSFVNCGKGWCMWLHVYVYVCVLWWDNRKWNFAVTRTRFRWLSLLIFTD